jgi:putative ABC transport system permease protein
MSILSKASRNFLFQHPWQLGLAMLGIMLGIAVVVSIDLALTSSLNAFIQTTQALSGKASHRITTSSGAIDDKLYTHLRVEQGFDHLAPRVNGYVQVKNNPEQTLKIHGIDLLTETIQQSSWQQQNTVDNSLRLMTEPNTVIISPNTAAQLGLTIGEHLLVSNNGNQHALIIIDLLTNDENVTEELMNNVVLTDIGTAQIILGMTGKLSAIDVLIKPDQPSRINAIKQSLPPDIILQSLDTQQQALHQMTQAFSLNLTAMGMLSLLVGMFLIYNTMTFLVIQRRSLIGCLRALGVTRQQIFRLMLGEAFCLGLIGTALGILLGIVLAQNLLHLIAGTINLFYFRIDHTSLLLNPWQIGKALGLGLVTTLLAVLAPAWEATCQGPRQTLIRSELETSMQRLLQSASILAIVLFIISSALIWITDKAVAPGLISIFLMLLGFALLTPAITRLLMQLLEKTLPNMTGVLFRLPARMVRAEISRTGLAVATLMIAVAASIGIELMINSFRHTVSNWLSNSLTADLYVAVKGNPAATDKTEQDQRLLRNITALANVQQVSNVLHTEIFVDETATHLTVFTLNDQARQGFNFIHSTNQVWNSFDNEDSIFITEPYAYLHNLTADDTLSLRTTRGGIKSFRIAAIYTDYSGDQGHLAMSRTTYLKYWPDAGFTGIGIYAKPQTNLRQLEAEITRLLAPYQSINSDQAIYRTSMQMFARTFKITETLRWLAASIAFVGVFSALMALQFENIRQLAVLRAIGMTPWQIARLIGTETGLLGLIAGLLAIPVGIMMAYVLTNVIYQRSFGWQLAMQWDFSVFGQGLLLALTAAILAGIVPAIKMAHTLPAVALRNE